VGLDIIRYRKADNLDGPVYDLPKANVYMIIYSNGTSDVINAQNAPANNNGNNNQDNLTYNPNSGNADAPITTAPPVMPTYDQPYCPGPGYIWIPGYWAWGIPGGYYWVPGVWVFAPRPGYLWTPGYWGFAGGYYGWHQGYWGEHIGYYGGVYYGYGYGGSGYYGGRWNGGVFEYNTSVSRVDNAVVHTTYVDNTVVRNAPETRASYNGPGGVAAQPTPTEKVAMNEQHLQPTVEQQSHMAVAKSDKTQYASVNNGKPTVTAMNKPGGQAFSPEGHTAALHPNTAPAANGAKINAEPAQARPANNAPKESTPAAATPQKSNTPAPATPQKSSTPAPATQHKNTQPNNAKQQRTNKSKPKPVSKPAPAPAREERR